MRSRSSLGMVTRTFVVFGMALAYQLDIRQISTPAEAHHRFVDVAPAPVFAGLGGADDRVAGVLMVGGGVFADRVVAAADVAAGLAHPQVHPLHALRQALLATRHLAREVEDLNRVEVRALSHCR